MDKDGAIRKITKLLALATSSNEAEAAAAKRQADALMKKFGLDQLDVQAAQIDEQCLKSAGKDGIPIYENMLANAVAKVFGARALFQTGETGEVCTWRGWRKTRKAGTLSFVAPSAQAKLSVYCFEALRRQMRSDRRKLNARLSQVQAEAWAIGWVAAVTPKLEALNMGFTQDAANAYVSKQVKSVAKTSGRLQDGLSNAGEDAIALARLGNRQGQKAQLHAAVHGQEGLKQIGTK